MLADAGARLLARAGSETFGWGTPIREHRLNPLLVVSPTPRARAAVAAHAQSRAPVAHGTPDEYSDGHRSTRAHCRKCTPVLRTRKRARAVWLAVQRPPRP